LGWKIEEQIVSLVKSAKEVKNEIQDSLKKIIIASNKFGKTISKRVKTHANKIAIASGCAI